MPIPEDKEQHPEPRPTRDHNGWLEVSTKSMWNVRHKLTPTTLGGKLGTAAALGGVVAALPTTVLGTLLSQTQKKI